jgi:hypothetical protein
MGRSRSRHSRYAPGAVPRREQRAAGKCPACGKDSYTSKKLAKQDARRLFPGDTMRVYPCPGSRYWHMTSADAQRAAGIRARLADRGGAG